VVAAEAHVRLYRSGYGDLLCGAGLFGHGYNVPSEPLEHQVGAASALVRGLFGRSSSAALSGPKSRPRRTPGPKVAWWLWTSTVSGRLAPASRASWTARAPQCSVGERRPTVAPSVLVPLEPRHPVTMTMCSRRLVRPKAEGLRRAIPVFSLRCIRAETRLAM